MKQIGFIKKAIVKAALGIARVFLTADMVKEWIRELLTNIAARAHSGDRTKAILDRSTKVANALGDGVVSVEEIEIVCGDLVTTENIKKSLDWIETKLIGE